MFKYQTFLLIYMKVYCPSKNRPDSPLFSMSEGLYILIQTSEDWKSYQKWNGRHNLIYRPELDGLLDCRNWIYENTDDWILMLDDDVSYYKKYLKNDEYIKEIDISWDELINETEHILSEIDNTQVGMVGFNNYHEFEFTKSYQTSEKFNLYQSIILNIPLLKSKGFKYESYPFDGISGKKGYGEDMSTLFFCHSNDLQIIRINDLYFEINQKNDSITFGDNKNKEKMLLMCYLYFLGKYKDYPIIKDDLDRRTLSWLSHMKHNSLEDIENEIVNGVLYETLNFEKEKELEMKKFLIVGLMVVVSLSTVFLMSCGGDGGDPNGNENGNQNGNDNGDNTEPVVSIIGEWVGEGWTLRFRENTVFEDTIPPGSSFSSLSSGRWEINDTNTEIKLKTVFGDLQFTVQCTLTATILTVTNFTYHGPEVTSGSKVFPTGTFTKNTSWVPY